MPVKINDKIYKLPVVDLDERGLTMAEKLMIETKFKQPAEKLFANISISSKAFKSLSEERQDEIAVERNRTFAIMVWIARNRAGENLTFEEANDVEMQHLDIVEPDADPLAKNPVEPITE